MLARGKVLVVFAVLGALSLVVQGAPGSRISGGSEAEPGQLPFMVSFQNLFNGSYIHICGGSILTRRTILTSALCLLDDAVNTDFEVYVGSNKLSEGGTSHKVAGFIRHPKFNLEGLLSHDTGVVYLERELQYSALVQPILLEEEVIGGNISATVAGWGYINYNDTAQNGDLPDKLQLLSTETLTNQDCLDKLPSGTPMPDESHICFFKRIGEGICAGDWGGPLVRNGKLIGVISWTFTLCSHEFPEYPEYPEGAARISTDLDWIKSVTI